MTSYAWTDGSSRPHTTHCGGAAVRLLRPTGEVETSGFHECSTESQRMELQAILEAIDMVAPGERLHIYTDSQYAVKGFQGEWKLRKNIDLWAKIRPRAAGRKVTLEWVARCSTPDLILVDDLAKSEANHCPYATG